jgi:HEAT repeat protein
VRAEAALAFADLGDARAVALLAGALGTTVDEEQQQRLVDALGRTRSHAALAPLLAQLDGVRIRAEVVRALSALGDRGAVAPLAKRIATEPYVSARVEMARALGALAPAGDARTLALLQRVARDDHEDVVRAAATDAVRRLRDGAAR